MSFFKKLSPFVLGFMLLAGAAFAQGQQTQPATDVSDEELAGFVASTTEAQAIQQESQQKLQNMVQEEGLEFQRFQTIMLSKQNPQAADSIEISKKEQEAIATIQPKMTQLNQNARQDFVAAIEDNGLTQERFQEILQAVQSNPEIGQRFQKMQAEQNKSDEADN